MTAKAKRTKKKVGLRVYEDTYTIIQHEAASQPIPTTLTAYLNKIIEDGLRANGVVVPSGIGELTIGQVEANHA